MIDKRLGGFVVMIACALPTLAAATEFLLYEQDFEGEAPAIVIHTDSRQHTIHHNGITDEMSSGGTKSWKLDVSFEDGDYFYVMFPTRKFPVADDMEVTAKVFVKEGGQAGLGHNFLAPQSREPKDGPLSGCPTWKLWSDPTPGWQALLTDGNELRNQGEGICAGILTDPRFLGLPADYLPSYLNIEDPLYDAWYINVRFMKGRRVVVYVDDVQLTSRRTIDQVVQRAQGAQARFESEHSSLMKKLSDDAEACLTKARAASGAGVERLRNAFEQSRAAWEDAPGNLYEWLVRAAALGRFAEGLEAIDAPLPKTSTKRMQTDVSVFSVRPILPADQLPAPTEPPALSLRESRIEIAVCPGEVDFGSLCVYAGREPLEDVAIRVSDLVADDESNALGRSVYLKQLPEAWKFKIDPDNKGVADRYFGNDVDVADWVSIRTDVDKGWDGQGFEKERIGYGWYRTPLAADAEAAQAKHRSLCFQAVDEDAYVYINGKLVFEHTERTTGLTPGELWITPFAVPLDDVWSGEDDAEIVVRVYNRTALGGVWKPAYLAASDRPLAGGQLKELIFERQTMPTYARERGIDGNAFDPYLVQWWYRINLNDRKGPPVFCGELLVKDPELVTPDHDRKCNKLKYVSKEMRDAATLQTTDLLPGRGLQYVILARIPADTPPGAYSGTVAVTSGDAVIADFPIAVTVLPFRLSRSIVDYTVYYRGGKLGAQPGAFAPVDSEYKTDAQLESDVADMLDHGIRQPIWYAAHERILKARRAFGIRGDVLVTSPGTPREDQTRYIEWAADVVEELRAGGCESVYIAGPDEPDVDRMAEAREQIENAHRLLNAKVFSALCVTLSWENLRRHLDLAIVGIDDAWNAGRAMPPGRELVAKWHSGGKLVYSYGAYASYHVRPLGFRRYYGFRTWKVGCDGAAPYVYQHVLGDPWDALALSCNFTWPTVDGRISTLQWEGMRAAVTDVRYVSTLVEWLGKTAGPIADQPARMAAEQALASIDPDGDLDAQRAEIIRHILSLQGAMQEIPD